MQDMRRSKKLLVQGMTLLGAALSVASLALFSIKMAHTAREESLITQNTYFGPTKQIPGDPYLVKVEVLVRDSAEAGGPQIQNVVFDGTVIPLKPRDIFGKRAMASFQLAPGNYDLRWTVRRDKTVWPRTIMHAEEVELSPKDLWIQILIEGDTASIR